MNQIQEVYNILLKHYGKQGWWPIQGKYSGKSPKNDDEVFEICLGAILTQNTSWKNVEKALNNFEKISKEAINSISDEELKEKIRPSGYYNQKTRKIREFLKAKEFTREKLLEVWGLGPETVDSILLYAYNKPYFVIDAYTKRVFERLGISFNRYEDLQELFHKSISSETYKEYHALIVEHCKQHCTKKPSCNSCPLANICTHSQKYF
ncbi:endonuclease [archaeon]|jgi:endonuclease III related protein|nr:endonuclease [archaeon]